MKRTATLFLAGLVIVSLAGCDAFNKGFRKGFFKGEMDAWANRGMAGGAFAEMRKDYPADYESMKGRLADKYAAGASDADETQEALIELKTFIAGKSDDVAKAPQDALLPINAQRTRIFDAVRAESIEACANMSQGGMAGTPQSSPRRPRTSSPTSWPSTSPRPRRARRIRPPTRNSPSRQRSVPHCRHSWRRRGCSSRPEASRRRTPTPNAVSPPRRSTSSRRCHPTRSPPSKAPRRCRRLRFSAAAER